MTKGPKELQDGKKGEIAKEKQVNTGRKLQVAASNTLEKDQLQKKITEGATPRTMGAQGREEPQRRHQHL